jgi:hypothetical protein
MELVHRFTGLLFQKLYPVHPQRLSFTLNAIDQDADATTLSLYRDAMLYLRDSGLINFQAYANTDPPYFENVVLTDNGVDWWTATTDEPEKRQIGFRLPHGS